MLTPYDQNSRSNFNDNYPKDCTKNPSEIVNMNRPTLKRTNDGELHQKSSVKRVKSNHNREPNKESCFINLKEHIKIRYPKELPHLTTCSEPIDFSTAYHFAAKKFDLELIKLLLLYGAPVNALDEKKENALMVACRMHQVACQRGEKFIKRSEKCIKRLLDAKCNPLQQNMAEISPIRLIASTKSVELFKKLKELNYDLNMPLNAFGDSLLMNLCYVLENNKPEESSKIVNALVDLGCDPMQKNQFGTSSLEILVRNKILDADGYLSLLKKIPGHHLQLAYNTLFSTDNCKVFDMLIAKGANIDTFDSKDKSPLYRAVEKLNGEMITYLLRKRANCKLERPAGSVHMFEASTPYELLRVKMQGCYEIFMVLLIELKNLTNYSKKMKQFESPEKQGLDHKALTDLQEHKDIQEKITRITQEIKKQKDLFDQYPSFYLLFLFNDRDATNEIDHCNNMFSYLLKYYQIFLQSEEINSTSNEVMKLLKTFQILLQKVLNESESVKNCPMDALYHLQKSIQSIKSLISAQYDPIKTSELLNNLMNSMEKRFFTENHIEDVIEMSSADDLEDTESFSEENTDT